MEKEAWKVVLVGWYGALVLMFDYLKVVHNYSIHGNT